MLQQSQGILYLKEKNIQITSCELSSPMDYLATFLCGWSRLEAASFSEPENGKCLPLAFLLSLLLLTFYYL